jgi:hypothetical protein
MEDVLVAPASVAPPKEPIDVAPYAVGEDGSCAKVKGYKASNVRVQVKRVIPEESRRSEASEPEASRERGKCMMEAHLPIMVIHQVL